MKYQKIRFKNADCHVFEFDPTKYNSQVTEGIAGKYEPLTKIEHSWYIANGYEAICKINFGFFGQGIEHYGWYAYDSGFTRNNPETNPSIECYLTQDKQFEVVNLTMKQAQAMYKNLHWGASLSFPLVVEGKQFTDWGKYATAYNHYKTDNPRTAVGQRKDKTMILVVVDGRSGYDAGLTAEELAEFMYLLGCWYAINADGGGSSEMVVKTSKGQTIVNSPSDGKERLVGSTLQVFAKKEDKLIIDTSVYMTMEEYLKQQKNQTPIVTEPKPIEKEGESMTTNKLKWDVWLGVGHGGKDPGAVANGIIERDINLTVALRVKQHLERHAVKVGIDRTDNTTDRPTKPNNIRVADAKANPAKIALDIHHNATGDGTHEGFQIIHYGKGGSKEFAYILAEEFEKTGQKKDSVFTKNGEDGKPYYYWIREIDLDSVISEFAFIDNINDANKIKNHEWLEKESIAIGKALLRFLGKEWVDERVLSDETLEQELIEENKKLREVNKILMNDKEQLQKENELLKQDVSNLAKDINAIYDIVSKY